MMMVIRIRSCAHMHLTCGIRIHARQGNTVVILKLGGGLVSEQGVECRLGCQQLHGCRAMSLRDSV